MAKAPARTDDPGVPDPMILERIEAIVLGREGRRTSFISPCRQIGRLSGSRTQSTSGSRALAARVDDPVLTASFSRSRRGTVWVSEIARLMAARCSLFLSRIVMLSISSPGAASIATDRVRTVFGISLRRSIAIRSNTGAHSRNVCCRKIRIVGYHGLSSRPNSQRQSGVVESGIQTGTPKRPRPDALPPGAT